MTNAELEFVERISEYIRYTHGECMHCKAIEEIVVKYAADPRRQVLQLFEYCVANGVNFAGCMK